MSKTPMKSRFLFTKTRFERNFHALSVKFPRILWFQIRSFSAKFSRKTGQPHFFTLAPAFPADLVEARRMPNGQAKMKPDLQESATSGKAGSLTKGERREAARPGRATSPNLIKLPYASGPLAPRVSSGERAGEKGFSQNIANPYA
jgi:hypothetical protein